MPCDKVFSWMVFAICNFSTHRITCYMHVYRRHKNRHLKAFFIEVFLFENLLDNHNFTVYWRKHFVGVWIEISFRIAKELKNQYQNEQEPNEDAVAKRWVNNK